MKFLPTRRVKNEYTQPALSYNLSRFNRKSIIIITLVIPVFLLLGFFIAITPKFALSQNNDADEIQKQIEKEKEKLENKENQDR